MDSLKFLKDLRFRLLKKIDFKVRGLGLYQGGMVDRVPKELYVAVRALCLIDSAPKQSRQKFKHNIDHTGM